MLSLQCAKCSIQDHHGYGNYFCRCEDRNIHIAKELRERGMGPWQSKELLEVYADDEEDFVQKFLITPRPCVIWMKGNFDKEKIDKICERRGIYFINADFNGKKGITCLPQKPNLDQASDSKS